jgi:hypothetical protein
MMIHQTAVGLIFEEVEGTAPRRSRPAFAEAARAAEQIGEAAEQIREVRTLISN